MNFEKINDENIKLLYDLNKQLAIEENQEKLFSSTFEDYKKLFLDERPCANAFLIYKEKDLTGFIIYVEKVATYLGKKVIYLEDIYLKEKYKNENNINELFSFVKDYSIRNNYIRIEMRVLKSHNIGYSYIKNHGFNKIDKWDIHRIDLN